MAQPGGGPVRRPGGGARRALWAFGAVWAALVLLGVWGLWSRFLPTDAWVATALPFVWAHWALASLGLVALMEIERRRIEPRPWRRRLALVALSGITWICALGLWVDTAPMLAAYAGGQRMEREATVERRLSSFRTRACDGGVYIEAEYWVASRLCGLPRALWDRIEPGARLRIGGLGVAAGQRYDEVELVE